MFALILEQLGLNCFNVLYKIFLRSKLIAKSILGRQNGHKKSKKRRPSISRDVVITDTKRYLTIIPRAGMGSESIAHEAEGRMGY